MDKLRAFQVDDDDAYDGLRSVVVFAKRAVEARKRGAQELDIEFESVSSCRRAPAFDAYADRGFVPVEVLIGYGWSYECAGCCQVVSDCGETEDGDPFEPVYTDHDVWCTPTCKAAHDHERYLRKQIGARSRAAMARMLEKRYPGTTPKEYHVHSRGTKIIQAIVRFDFPGGKYGGSMRFRCEHSDTSRGNPSLWVATGDLPAWENYASSVRALAEKEPRP